MAKPIKMKQPDEITVNTSNLMLCALSWGKCPDPPVIALHGWLDNAASFIPIAQHLSGLNLVALDLPGHGKSEHRRGANAYHFIDYVTDVVQAADALGFERFGLLGHSLGAAVCAAISAAVPDRIDRLAMIEGFAPVTDHATNTAQQLKSHVSASLPAAGAPRVYPTLDDAAKARQRAGDLSFKSAKLIAKRNLQAAGNGFIWRSDKKLTRPSPLYLTQDHVKSYMAGIRCKSLLVRTADGIIRNWESLKNREHFLDGLNIIDIEGGHHCHMDSPHSVAECVLPFLAGNEESVLQ